MITDHKGQAMNDTPKQMLARAFQKSLRDEFEDTGMVELRDLITKLKRFRHLRPGLLSYLADEVHEMKLEDVSRSYPGMIGTLFPENA